MIDEREGLIARRLCVSPQCRHLLLLSDPRSTCIYMRVGCVTSTCDHRSKEWGGVVEGWSDLWREVLVGCVGMGERGREGLRGIVVD